MALVEYSLGSELLDEEKVILYKVVRFVSDNPIPVVVLSTHMPAVAASVHQMLQACRDGDVLSEVASICFIERAAIFASGS